MERAALQLVQQDVLPTQEGGALPLPGVAGEGGGRCSAEGGAEGRGQGAGRYHSFMNRDFLQRLWRGYAGNHALWNTGGLRGGQLEWLHPGHGLHGALRGEGGEGGGARQHHAGAGRVISVD